MPLSLYTKVLSVEDLKHKSIIHNVLSITPDYQKNDVIAIFNANCQSLNTHSLKDLYSWDNVFKRSYLRSLVSKINNIAFRIFSLNSALGNVYFHLFRPKIVPLDEITLFSGARNNRDILKTNGDKFVASFVYEKGTGSCIFHVYDFDNCFIVPIYQGSLNSLSGTLIGIKKLNICFFLHSFKLGKTLGIPHSTIVEFLHSQILNKLSSTHSGTTDLGFSLYIGGKLNFGHTLINDSSILDINLEKIRPTNFQLIIGNYDYFGFFDILRNHSKISSKLNAASINDFKINDKLYFLPNQFLLPLPVRRPSRRSLNLIRDQLINKAPVNNTFSQRKAIYLLLDERTGCRKIKNWLAIVSTLAEYCTSKDISNVFIDGYTSYIMYSSSLNDENLANNARLSTCFMKQMSQVFGRKNINATSLDALTISDKLKICSGFDFVGALTAYGSGMVFPIYILNCPVLLLGTDIISIDKFKKWRWHFSLLCHSQRYQFEHNVMSKNVSNDGFSVSIPSLLSALNQL